MRPGVVPFICLILPDLASARVTISKCFCGYQFLGWHNILGSLPWPQIVQCSSCRMFPLILPPWYLPWTLLMPLHPAPTWSRWVHQWICATFLQTKDWICEWGLGKGSVGDGITLPGTSVCRNHSWALEKFPRWLGFFFFWWEGATPHSFRLGFKSWNQVSNLGFRPGIEPMSPCFRRLES